MIVILTGLGTLIVLAFLLCYWIYWVMEKALPVIGMTTSMWLCVLPVAVLTAVGWSLI